MTETEKNFFNKQFPSLINKISLADMNFESGENLDVIVIGTAGVFRENCLDKQQVRDAIETALPDVCIGGSRTPDDNTMNQMQASKRFLMEELGL